jgi:hypothetical protein
VTREQRPGAEQHEQAQDRGDDGRELANAVRGFVHAFAGAGRDVGEPLPRVHAFQHETP